jgi:succinate dehydrogenase hydrophobic anchor subunit
LFVSIGLSSDTFMRVTGVLGAALLILGLGFLVIDTFMSLESSEHAARRTLDNRQRR